MKNDLIDIKLTLPSLRISNSFLINSLRTIKRHTVISLLQHKVSDQDKYQDIQYLDTPLFYGFVSPHL
jgi:hypothetical protein